MVRTVFVAIFVAWVASGISSPVAWADPAAEREAGVAFNRGLVAHWPLAGDAQDHSGNSHHAQVHGMVDRIAAGPAGQPRTAAEFNGRDAFLEVPMSVALRLGKGDFSLAAWVHTEGKLDDVPGDLVSQYDSAQHRGFHLTLKSNAAVASTQSNFRQLQFGIDNNHETPWTDCGRPGKAILAFGLVALDGHLYAGTCEPHDNETGRVYRYRAPSEWMDCGSPTPANSVTAMAACDGKLYAGTGKYRLAGSALGESNNPHLGGRVLRYDGGQMWTDCGQLPGVEAIGGMVVYRGQLYASSLYRPAGFFRYDGGDKWTDCGTPGKRVEALGVYNGYLYGTSYDQGHVFRFDGMSWTDCGQLGGAQENTQTYSFAVFGGRLYVGTWRTGRVYRFDDLNRWTDVGRLGDELEVMGMLVHNGRLIAGTLPLAEVYSYDGNTQWRRMTRLDMTPDVTYRRAWTMAEFQGRVFCSTLPSGHIYSFQAGQTASWDHEFPAGWHHVAAVKAAGKLRLFVDGRAVAQSGSFEPDEYDLDSDAPLRIGFGRNDYFLGRLHDVRLYRRALTVQEIGELALKRQPQN